jgi:hypothetical protein
VTAVEASAATRYLGRALRASILVLILVSTAWGTLVAPLHAWDVRLPIFAIAILATSPGWVLLLLAARGRGASWPWLAFALAWGASAAVWIALTGERLMEQVSVEIARAVHFLGPTVVEAAPSTVVAPIVEEPAKLLGIWIGFAATRRAGAAPSVALGAAIGGLVGIGFGVAEVAHHLGVIVSELGHIDLAGEFMVDWSLIQLIAQQQLLHKFFLAGLTNHALFSALAGAGLALFAQRRRGLAVACFVAALAAHALLNSVGVQVTQVLGEALVEQFGPLQPGAIPSMLAGWLVALAAFVVAEGWAAVLLVWILRRREPLEAPTRPAVP